jgi:uncharacterized protein (DUF1499 family)
MKYFITLFILMNAFTAQGEDMNQKCGDKPNCVSSFETRKDFTISSLKNVNGSWDEIKSQILSILKSMGSNQIHESEKNYLHVIFTTKLMRYKDDVYFWWNPETKELHFKSESRTGYWDMNANRKRLNSFIAKWGKNS